MNNRAESVSFEEAENKALDLFEANNPQAFIWFEKAEAIALAARNEKALCGLYGDWAMAFKQAGNFKRAVEKNLQAISYCEKFSEHRLLAMWLGNLSVVYQATNQTDKCRAILERALRAAIMSKDKQQINYQLSNIASYLNYTKNFYEGIEIIEREIPRDATDAGSENILLGNLFALYTNLANQYTANDQLVLAIETLHKLLGWYTAENASSGICDYMTYLQLALLYEKTGNYREAKDVLQKGIDFFKKLDQPGAVSFLTEKLTKFGNYSPSITERDKLSGSKLAEDIKTAKQNDDKEKELTAKVNYCIALLNEDDDRAEAAFEETLAEVMRAGDKRRELILYNQFVPALYEWGQDKRALALASKAVSLAENSVILYRVLALYNYAEQFEHAFPEDKKTYFEHVSKACDELALLGQKSPEAYTVILEQRKRAIAGALIIGIDVNEYENAKKMGLLIGINIDDYVAPPPKVPSDADINDIIISSGNSISAQHNEIILQWRDALKQEGPTPTEPQNELVKRMADFSSKMSWNDIAIVFNKMIQPAKTSGTVPHNGALHFAFFLIDFLKTGITHKNIEAQFKNFDFIEDDFPLMILYVFFDKTMSKVAHNYLTCVTKITANELTRARSFELMAIFSTEDNSKYTYLANAVTSLTKDIYDAEKARLLIRAVELLLAMSRLDEAGDSAAVAADIAKKTGNIALYDRARGTLGNIWLRQRKIKEAKALFEEVLESQKINGDATGYDITKINLQLCYDILGIKKDVVNNEAAKQDPYFCFSKGMLAASQKDYDTAIAHYDKAFALVKSQFVPAEKTAKEYHNFARILVDAGERERAIAEMNKAIEQSKAAGLMPLLYNCWQWMATVYFNDNNVNEIYAKNAIALGEKYGADGERALDTAQLGQVYRFRHQFDAAIIMFERSLQIKPQKKVLIELASAYASAKNFKKAGELYDKLLEQRNTQEEQLKINCNLGIFYQAQQNYPLAEQYFLSALQLSKKMPDSEAHLQILNNLASLFNETGNLEKAIVYMEAALKSGFNKDNSTRKHLLFSYSNSLKLFGELDKAQAILHELLKTGIAKADDDFAAKVKGALANIYLSKNDKQNAINSFKEALNMAPATSKITRAICLSSLGNVYTSMLMFPDAVPLLKEASGLFAADALWINYLVSQLALSQSYFILKDQTNLQQCFENIKGAVAKPGSATQDWIEFLVEAQLHLLVDEWIPAKKAFEKSIGRLEATRSLLSSAEDQRKWSENFQILYDMAAKYAIVYNDGPAAIAFFEFSRTRYLSSIKEQIKSRPADFPEQRWAQYIEAKNKYQQLERQNRTELFDNNKELIKELHKAKTNFERLKNSIPGIVANQEIKIQETVKFNEDWIEKLPDNSVTFYLQVFAEPLPAGLGVLRIVKHAGGKWSSNCFMDDSFKMKDLSGLIMGNREELLRLRTEEELKLLSPEFLGMNIIQLPIRNEQRKKMFLYLSEFLSKRIWPLLLKDLPQQIKHIVLIPSTGLNVVPLHIAKDADGKYLIEKFKFTFLPSLKLHEISLGKSVSTLAQIINPTQDLFFAAEEAKLVLKYFGKENLVLSKYGKDATAEQALNGMRNSDIFYFTGHGYYNHDNLLYSGLVCSAESSRPGFSQVLDIETILGTTAEIKANMIVLSSCQSGIVKSTDMGNDFIGLPGAFLSAGASIVLSSLWPVDERATACLIAQFFKYWKEDQLEITEAFSKAQNWLFNLDKEGLKNFYKKSSVNSNLKSPGTEEENNDDDADKPFANPFYWGSFFLTGY